MKTQHKPLDVITLFHKAASPASVRVAAALRQASAAASETSTEDQANAVRRAEFKLEITEDPPTADQLKTILEYVGAQRIGSIVKGADDEDDALRTFKENVENFQRPVVCLPPSPPPRSGFVFSTAEFPADQWRRLSTGLMARLGPGRTSRRF
jgi:hypothetical protein